VPALDVVSLLLSGALAVSMALVGLFFLRYYRTTGDRLFASFAIVFWLMAANRLALSFFADDEVRTYLYLVRLAAFLLIIGAIWDKNRGRRAAR
jgi:hypothetical protein